jgi:hypothetical protein
VERLADRRSGVRYHVETDAWDDAERFAACRLVLQTVAADVHHYETDIPVADPDWPPQVAAAAGILRAVGHTERGGYSTTGIIRTADLWSSFVTLAPRAYDATVWNRSYDDIVSLADESRSIVVRLRPVQHAALSAALGDARLVRR